MIFRCRDLFGLLSLWLFVLCAVRGIQNNQGRFCATSVCSCSRCSAIWLEQKAGVLHLVIAYNKMWICLLYLKNFRVVIYSDFLGQYWTGIIEWMSGWQMIFCYNPILSFALLTMIDYMLLQKCFKTLLLIKKQWLTLWIVPLYTPLILIRFPFDKSRR